MCKSTMPKCSLTLYSFNNQNPYCNYKIVVDPEKEDTNQEGFLVAK